MIIPYPEYQPKIKGTAGKELIFDEVRKQWVKLTPEEWVRQNFLNYLVKVKQYPPALIAVEKEILAGEMKKRFDILVYQNDKPWMIIECKEQNFPLTEAVIKQLLAYYSVVQTSYMVITNGHYTHCFGVKERQVSHEPEIPGYTP
ncbi:MAG TPA: type I restriction enzyme HsdR N-terminal domain-containing protein [Sediminibacterium sp.]|nr:type I restriction enzyme HsdR N-terminal domain-containing protein [Sediminibacterium sp.]